MTAERIQALIQHSSYIHLQIHRHIFVNNKHIKTYEYKIKSTCQNNISKNAQPIFLQCFSPICWEHDAMTSTYSLMALACILIGGL